MDIMEKTAQLPVLPAIITLIEINLVPVGVPQVFYCTPMVGASGFISWGGNSYMPFPVAIRGLEMVTSGAPPRAELHIANVLNSKLFGTLAFTYGDLVGAEVVYRKIFSNLLNTNISTQPFKMIVNKKIAHNKSGLAFELKSVFDRDNAVLPKRQMLRRDFPGLGINKRVN